MRVVGKERSNGSLVRRPGKHAFRRLVVVTAAGGALVVGATLPAGAATPATLDPSFASNGSVTTDFGGSDTATDVALMPDGRIVVVGNSNGKVAIARYLPNGALDKTFSGDGRVTTGGYTAASVALQPDGKIVVWGSALLRYTTSGALDPTFGDGGIVTTEDSAIPNFSDVIVERNGEIATLGLTVSLFSPTGRPLAFADVDGGEGFRTLAEQSNGKLLAGAADDCAYAFIQRWLQPSLQRDPSYSILDGPSGIESLNLFVQPNDHLLLVSRDFTDQECGDISTTGITFGRYLPDGTRDTSFGTDGVVFANTSTWPSGTAGVAPIASALAPSGKIMVLGDNYLARFTPAGALDRSFSGDGILPVSGATWSTLAVQGDSDIIVVGSSGGNFVVRRYLGSATITRYPVSLAIQAGGGTRVGGEAMSLAATDGNAVQLKSTTAGTRTTSWTASMTHVPNTLSSMRMSYTGASSSLTHQTVAIWDYTHRKWVTLDTRSVSTGSVTVNHTFGGHLADYVSGNSGIGTVTLRVLNTGSSNFTTSADRMSISYS